MPIKVRCPECGDAFQTSSKNRGQRVACPLCSASIRVSKRSKKDKAKSKAATEGAAESDNLSDDAIVAVLADGDDFQREYVPRGLDNDDPSEVEADGAVGFESVDLPNTTGNESSAVLDSYDSIPAPVRPAQAADGGSSSGGFDWRRAAAPFAVGVVVGAVAAGGVMTLLGGGGSPTPRPVTPRPAPRPAAPPVQATTPAKPVEAAAPPENDEERAALLKQLVVTSASVETSGGLLGGGRTLVIGVRNDSGLVLESVTFNAQIGFAAFADSVLAEEDIAYTFSPLLGLGEEQTVRIKAPSGGPIANAKAEGALRLTAKVIDLNWRNGEG